jgi:hypothetical protein
MSQKGSAIIGKEIEGIFFVSHYAPKTNKDGVILLRKLASDSCIKTVFFVTEDLVDMLVGCGFKTRNKEVMAVFRGTPTKKIEVTSANV